MPGKKGFDRLVQSCSNTFLREPVQFLINIFSTTAATCPLAPLPDFLHATAYPYSFDLLSLGSVYVPTLDPLRSAHIMAQSLTKGSKVDILSYQKDVEIEGISHLFEWACMLSLESPRIQQGDDIHPLMSSYQVLVDDPEEQPRVDQMTIIRLEGLITSKVLHQIFSELL